MHTWRFVVDIYEPGTNYPVVRHVFSGMTKDEAAGYFKAHMGTDVFLHDCVTKAKWKDVNCEIQARWVPPGEPVEEP